MDGHCRHGRTEDETRRILAEARKLDVEAYKLQAERWELDEQERKLRRDRELTVWHVVVIGLGGGAGLFAAGAAFARLFLL